MFPFRLSLNRPVIRFLIAASAEFLVLALPGLAGNGYAQAQGIQMPQNLPTFGVTTTVSDSVVTGVPYEAERVLHTKRSLADGTISTQDSSIREARDSSGRTIEETQSELPAASGRPLREFVFISVSDPVAKTLLTWSNLTKTGTLIHLPPAPPLNGRPQQTPEEGAVSLGHRMIHGLLCSGYSVQKTIPAGAMGNAAPITTHHEWWINDELHVKALEIFKDPQRGERTYELVSIKRGEPDVERFHAPSGYTVHEVNTRDRVPQTAEALDLAHAPAVSQEEANAMLASQDRQRRLGGAAVLVKAAQTGEDPAVKDDVAYKLAKANIGLAEAHSLADSAITSAEQDCARQSAPLTQRFQFTSQIALARRWDTLGYIYEQQGDFVAARSYLESAFKLDPRAYYGGHLAKILERAGDTEKAVAAYRVSLLAPGSEQLKGTLRERLTVLAGDSKTSDAGEEELPGTGNLTGKAFFDIVYSSSAQSPAAAFVSGDEPLRTLAPALARQESASFTLPDTGPERAVRRVEITCGAQVLLSSACRIRVLGAGEARDLIGQN